MNLIVVVDKNWGIGKNNGLLFRLKKDMAFFRETTTGKVIVMGANTFASFPNGALPNRVNIVLDSSAKESSEKLFYNADGNVRSRALIVPSVEQMDQALTEFAEKCGSDSIFVCGGASFYKLMLDRCKAAYVTKVNADGGAELFFPNLDGLPNWQLAEQSQPLTDGDYEISFCKYVNKNLQ